MNEPLFFIDRHVPYDVFLNDIASRVVKMIKLDANDPELVSQRMAYKMFGRRNVQRWKRMGCWPSSVNLGDFNQEGGSVRQITMTLQFDWCMPED